MGETIPGTASGVEGVRALAHPLRLELLDVLRFGGPSTATLLAGRLNESSGATSYHLRQLARYGFVEEVEQSGGRERWWRYRERKVSVPAGADDETGGRAVAAALLTHEAQALDRFLSEQPRSDDWDDAAFLQSRSLCLTSKELDALRCAIESLLAPLRRADAEDAPVDALPVRVFAFGFPVTVAGS
ncbi:MAG TPA: helix-turn-helix domain-containing protein [Acidimicrobiales bacterium]|nr:helix-turn-helix domain-containing protein [Acidimicrobiales bacterium]